MVGYGIDFNLTAVLGLLTKQDFAPFVHKLIIKVKSFSGA